MQKLSDSYQNFRDLMNNGEKSSHIESDIRAAEFQQFSQLPTDKKQDNSDFYSLIKMYGKEHNDTVQDRLLNFKPLSEKIEMALIHAKQYDQMNDALWGYQDFCLTIGELLEAALEGTKPVSVYSSFPDVFNLKNRLEKALVHATHYDQMNDALWGYQDFSITLGTLLESALRGFKK